MVFFWGAGVGGRGGEEGCFSLLVALLNLIFCIFAIPLLNGFLILVFRSPESQIRALPLSETNLRLIKLFT